MANELLKELQQIAGWTDEDLAQITITGEGPVVHSRFKIGEAAAAVHAACGLAAAKLWELRTGHKQHVTVDMREAMASLVNFMYLQFEPPKEATPAKITMTPAQFDLLLSIAGFYKTKDDRWFYFAGGFNLEPVFRILGCNEPKREAFAEAIKKRNGEELEDVFAENSLAGGVCRTPEEWGVTGQGKALRGVGVVDIKKVADSEPVSLPQGNRPLSGVRVLEMAHVLSGPNAGRTMAEHGSQVLRIDPPVVTDPMAAYICTGNGKRNTFLDIKKEDEKQKLWGLVPGADVFYHNYRVGSSLDREFSWEKVIAKKPGMVYARLTAFGSTGPWATRPGFEQVAQAVTGMMLTEAEIPPAPIDPKWAGAAATYMRTNYMSWHGEEGVPRLLPCALSDFMTGHLMAFGIMVALYRRATEGGSYVVTNSLVQSCMALDRMGRHDRQAAIASPDMMPEEVTRRLLVDEYGAFGHLTYLGSVVHMSETPTRWDLPVTPVGSSEPVWYA